MQVFSTTQIECANAVIKQIEQDVANITGINNLPHNPQKEDNRKELESSHYEDSGGQPVDVPAFKDPLYDNYCPPDFSVAHAIARSHRSRSLLFHQEL